MFHLGLAAALLLLEPGDLSTPRAVAYALLVAVAGLTGVVTASLAPLFVIRAWRTRTLPVIALAAIASACAVLQVVAISTGPLAPGRQAGLGLATAGLIVWMKTLVLPVLGVEAAHRFLGGAVSWVGSDLASPRAAAVGAGLLASAGIALAALSWPLSARVRLALGGSYVIVTAAVVLGGIGDRLLFLGHAESASRYFYVPGALVLFLLMANGWPADRPPAAARTVVCSGLLAFGLVLGVLRYRESLRWQPSWPEWRAEVAAWEQNPSRPLAIWPPTWTMSLRPRPAPRR